MMDDRLTRCPHCSTCFAISDADLQQAFGVARCGRCKKIFNAANHLFELEAETSVTPKTPAVKKNTAKKNPAKSKAAQPEQPVPEEIADKAQIPTKAPVPDQISPAESQPAQPTPKADPLDQLDAMPDIPDMALDDEDLTTIRKARKAPELRNHQLEVALTAEREELSNDLAPELHFTADMEDPEPRQKKSKTAGEKQGLPWIPATMAAGLILLILMLLWGNTRTLSESPGLSGFAEAICGLSSCDHYLPSDFDALEASQLAILQDNNQMTAELVLNNPTKNDLPFPAILLELRDRSGKVNAEILYQPDTYLKDKPFADHILPPELPVALSFPVQGNVGNVVNLSVRYYPSARH